MSRLSLSVNIFDVRPPLRALLFMQLGVISLPDALVTSVIPDVAPFKAAFATCLLGLHVPLILTDTRAFFQDIHLIHAVSGTTTKEYAPGASLRRIKIFL